MKNLLLILLCFQLAACSVPVKPRFAFFENVVIDQNTGITWAQNANLPGKPLVSSGDNSIYEYLTRLNATHYANYDDWRVPTRAELEKMIEYAKLLGYNETNHDTWPYKRLRQLGFIDVRNDQYWTSTRSAPDEMFTADMTNGKVTARSEAKQYYLWPVRGVGR